MFEKFFSFKSSFVLIILSVFFSYSANSKEVAKIDSAKELRFRDTIVRMPSSFGVPQYFPDQSAFVWDKNGEKAILKRINPPTIFNAKSLHRFWKNNLNEVGLKPGAKDCIIDPAHHGLCRASYKGRTIWMSWSHRDFIVLTQNNKNEGEIFGYF